MRSFGQAAFVNGLQYRHYNSKISSGNILPTFYANTMKIGPVTPDIMMVPNASFLDETTKIDLFHRIS